MKLKDWKDKLIVSRMGYEEGEFEKMEIKDIIELGKLGYTKEEIETMRKEEPASIPEDVQTQIDSLTEQIKQLKEEGQKAAARQTASTTDPGAMPEQSVDKILSQMAMQ